MAKGKLRRQLAAVEENLTSRPDAALVDILRIPEPFVTPGQRIVRRIIYATLALFAAVLLVYLDRDVYRDVQDNQLSFLDCLYYATVSLSTTGYGDIVLPERWRLSSAVEALTGILMCGWSTAFFFAIVSRINERTEKAT